MSSSFKRRQRPARAGRQRRGEAASRRRQVALSTIDAAISSGFALRAPGDGNLDILIPISVPREVHEPIIHALTTYKAEVIGILEYLDDQRGEGQTWIPPRRGTLQ
jgi:hypothetical protein